MRKKEFYKPGSFWRIDDKSGFKVRAEDTREEWTGAIVDQKLFEPRQPQDLVRGVKDDQSVPDARPRQTVHFVRLGLLTASSNLRVSGSWLASTGNPIGDGEGPD